jgi:hypothetical protein
MFAYRDKKVVGVFVRFRAASTASFKDVPTIFTTIILGFIGFFFLYTDVFFSQRVICDNSANKLVLVMDISTNTVSVLLAQKAVLIYQFLAVRCIAAC